MIGTEICPKCGTHFDGVWWRNWEAGKVAVEAEFTEYQRQITQLEQQLADALETQVADRKDGAYAQLREQLATAVEALTAIKSHCEGENQKRCLGCCFCLNTAGAALAKLGEGK